MRAGVVTGDAVMNDRSAKPDADPVVAPYGWAWDRSPGRWRPALKRGNYRRASENAPGPESVSSETGSAGQADSGVRRDPDPAWFAEKPADAPRPGGEVPAQVVNDIAGFAGLVGTPLLAMLRSADPYCGEALAQNYERVVDATLPLLLRSERVVKYFTGDKSDWLLWGKLAMALAPVARAVVDHHVLRTVAVVRDPVTGVVEIQARVRGGGPVMGEHVQPPQPDYSQYAA
jgi:hypothetical protein